MSLRGAHATIQAALDELKNAVDALEHEIDLAGVAGADTTGEYATTEEDTPQQVDAPITPPETTTEEPTS